MDYTTVVIGGGPAGMMAAGTAAERGNRVAILERNRVFGRKLLITGKGRCNITNATDIENHIANLFPQGKFLYSALNAFPPSALMNWLDQRGVRLKVERGQRVFPVDDDAHRIRNALVEFMKKNGVDLKPLNRVLECKKKGDKFSIFTEGGQFKSENLILATGGSSYPQTGSSGDGYTWAKNFGHKVKTPEPGLVPLIVKEITLAPAAGLVLRNVGLKLRDKRGKILFSELGEIEITENGFSGALVLSASIFVKSGQEFFLDLDLKPGLEPEQLDRRLQRDLENKSKENLRGILGGLLPRDLISPLIKFTGLDWEKPASHITREERQVIGEVLKSLSFSVVGKRDWSEAIITMGGVKCGEIIPATMESKLVPGLFFAGELINIHGFTGGYNLQLAFSTGFLAGENC